MREPTRGTGQVRGTGVVTATIAAWFVSRIHKVQEAEQRTEAPLVDVLAGLREVRPRLDSIEQRGARPTRE